MDVSHNCNYSNYCLFSKESTRALVSIGFKFFYITQSINIDFFHIYNSCHCLFCEIGFENYVISCETSTRLTVIMHKKIVAHLRCLYVVHRIVLNDDLIT